MYYVISLVPYAHHYPRFMGRSHKHRGYLWRLPAVIPIIPWTCQDGIPQLAS